MRRVLYDGRDVLPELIASDDLLGRMEEGRVFGLDWIRALGSVPNEYLYYYYYNRDAVRAIIDSGTTRGDFLARSQQEFYDRALVAGDGAAQLWRETIARRSASYMAEAKGGTQDDPVGERVVETDPAHQGYAGVALGVMAAITRNERATMILNVRNGTTVTGLPSDAVVEVPTVVDANGVHPLSTTQPDLHQIGLMSQVKDVERHIIAAALTGSKAEALKGFALHPLVDSVSVARDLVAGYVARIPEVAAVLTS